MAVRPCASHQTTPHFARVMPLTADSSCINNRLKESAFHIAWVSWVLEAHPTDKCKDDPKKIQKGKCGCGVSDVDSDGDGVPDCKGAPLNDTL